MCEHFSLCLTLLEQLLLNSTFLLYLHIPKQKNKMVSIASTFKALCLSFLFIAVASRPTIRPKVFNVRRYGSRPDGKTDNANVCTQ